MATEEVKPNYSKFFYGAMACFIVLGIILLAIDVPANNDWSGGLGCAGGGLVCGLIGFIGDKTRKPNS